MHVSVEATYASSDRRERVLRQGTWQERIALAWVAAASGDRALLPALADLRDEAEPGSGRERTVEAAIAGLERASRGAGAS